MKSWVALLWLFVLPGCVSVGEAGEQTTGHYLGYVRVRQPISANAEVRLEEITAIGGWVDTTRGGSGGGLGFRRAERARATPGSCGLTVLVSNDAQLAAVERLIRIYAEGQACIVKPNGEN